MSKFKVGDKVRILHTWYSGAGLEVGSVHEVVFAEESGVYLTARYDDGRTDALYFFNKDVETVGKPTNNLTVGQTYTSKNGYEWLCIAVDGEYAHMRLPHVPASPAYCFKTDGTNISQGGWDWDIKFEPVRESIEVHGSFNRSSCDLDPDYITYHHQMGDHKFTMTIDVVEGKPDWSSAKLTGA